MHVRFEALLNKLSGEFDVLIIDAPPILAVSDAAIIGRHAGVALIAARAGKHPISEFEQAVKRLNRAGVQVKGFIFNNVNIDRQSKHYGHKAMFFSTPTSSRDLAKLIFVGSIALTITTTIISAYDALPGSRFGREIPGQTALVTDAAG
jgi:Mrp family chromosome partitioning ATPase